MMIKMFAVTGGPCSGKTTALSRLVDFLSTHLQGCRIFIAPEAATIGFIAGVRPSDLGNPASEEGFLELVLQFQMMIENRFLKYAKSTGENCIILCDRGLMDGSAYVTVNQWQRVLSRSREPFVTTLDDGTKLVELVGLNNVTARDRRYDAVFHLVTAADGAVDYYTLENNLGARHETAEMARAQDIRTQNAWLGHPHHIIIDNNNKSFDQKMEELLRFVSYFVGILAPPRSFAATAVAMKKSRILYKLSDSHDFAKLLWVDEVDYGGYFKLLCPLDALVINNVLVFDIELFFLDTNELLKMMTDESNFLCNFTSIINISTGETLLRVSVRKRSQQRLLTIESCSLFEINIKKRCNDGATIKRTREKISEHLYLFLKKSAYDADKSSHSIARSIHFLYNKQSIAVYESIQKSSDSRPAFILECQTNVRFSDLPTFLKVDVDGEIDEEEKVNEDLSFEI